MKMSMRVLITVLLLVLSVSGWGAPAVTTPTAGSLNAADANDPITGGYNFLPGPLNHVPGKYMFLVLDYTSHASAGTFTTTLTGIPSIVLRGYVFIAGDGAQSATPTDNYDFDLLPVYANTRVANIGSNLFGTDADDLDSAASDDSIDGSAIGGVSIPMITGTYQLNGTNLGNSKKGRIILIFTKEE